MCEIPSNVILAEEFAEIFDGFSIGSNDLTQLVLGVDRDSEIVAHLFDERNPAVMTMIEEVIRAATGVRPQDRHLRPGAERLPRVRPLPGRAGDRQHLAQPGRGAQDHGKHARAGGRAGRWLMQSVSPGEFGRAESAGWSP